MAFEPASLLTTLTPWLLLLPLAGLFINLVLGARIGQKTAGWLATLAAFLTFAVAALLTWAVSKTGTVFQLLIADWIKLGSLDVSWQMRVDTLSTTMMLVVSGVGALIHLYAVRYMQFDTHLNGDAGRYRRFFVYFNLFLFAMLLLVSADNYLMMFVGWEGVGLCSYLLIGFWFEGGKDGLGNAKAAKKAFVVNRIGDFGILIAMFLLFSRFGTLQFDAVFQQAPAIAAAAPGILIAVTLLMTLGVTGKSAQLPLFVWLPDAMAGPTPVSALIHAATMVTAGVYLVARSSALFVLVPVAQTVVMTIGALTALLAATIAVAQWDIKKVLAYSTISQLGFMVAAVGMGATVAGMFHLITHAFFKALLFLSAGSVILGMEKGYENLNVGHPTHEQFDPQDMRGMGGLRSRQKVTFGVYLVGALALAGIAPLSGFFSKDEILASALQAHPWVFGVLLAAAFLTAFYMARQIYLIFFGTPRLKAAELAEENDPVILLPLVILALLAVIGGVLNFPGMHLLEHWLEPGLVKPLIVAFQPLVAGISLAVAVLGILWAWRIYSRVHDAYSPAMMDPLQKTWGKLFVRAQNQWGIDDFYRKAVVKPFDALAETLANPGKLGSVDGVLMGLGRLAAGLGNLGSKLENGYVRRYALVFLAGVVVIFAVLLML